MQAMLFAVVYCRIQKFIILLWYDNIKAQDEGDIMNKRLSRLLAAFLVLCMLPATFITAFARGKGVFHDEVENQSIENAKGQYIPETITIDGKLNDTGWPESNFNYADINTGYWNVEKPDSSVETAKFKYQLRSDLENIYIGASVVMPVNEATFYIYFRDIANSPSNAGYTHLVRFDINVSAKTVVCEFKDKENEKVYGVKSEQNNSDSKATLAYQNHALKFNFDENTVVFEMRNLIEDIFAGDMSKVTFITSLNFDVNGKTEALYHPKTRNDTTNKLFPTFDYWPTGGNSINTTYGNKADDLPYEVKVDGEFDEAVWSTLTNYYIHDEEHYDYEQNGAANGYISAEGDKIYGTGVKTDDNNHFLSKDTGVNPGYIVYNSNDVEGTRAHVRFKYELRVDGEYLYGAVVAYVPPIKEYVDNTGSDKQEYVMTTSPDLCIMFFDNERNTLENGQTNANEVASNEELQLYDGRYLPETILQIRSVWSDYDENDANKSKVFATYGNCWASKLSSSNTNVVEKIAWGKGMVDTQDPKQFQGTRSKEQEGNLWNFEFKVDINAIPTNDAGDIVFSIYVADRWGVNGSKYYRSLAFTGDLGKNEDYTKTFPQHNYDRQVSFGNVIYKSQIESAKEKKLDVTNKSNFKDGELDQAIWAALSGADNHVDGRERNGTNTTYVNYENYQFKNYAYKISADHEYLYGAMVLDEGWDADDIVKLWINRRKTKYELEQANGVDVDNTNYANYGGNRAIESISVKGASPYFSTPYRSTDLLFDGVYHNSDRAYGDNIFYAFREANSGNVEVVLELSELFASEKIDLYFSGAIVGADIATGIRVPDAVEIEYSLDGSSFKKASKSSSASLFYDNADDNFDAHCYSYTFGYSDSNGDFVPQKITARYIKLIIPANGNFIWLSEIDLFVTEAHGEIYAAEIPLSNESGSVYRGTQHICTANTQDGKFDYVIKKIEGGDNAGQQIIEFRVSLAELGIEQNLAASDLDDLFAYYFTVGGSDNVADSAGLVHPRNNTGRHPSTNWLLDETFDGANLFTYGDMLGDIKIDGKLDEKYWIANGKDGVGEANQELAEYVGMQHVDGTNGTWDIESKFGNTFSYDYKIYAGEGYLYGAAIIDVEAVAGDTPYTYVDTATGENLPITRFDIWIDNNINEYDWLYDGIDADNNGVIEDGEFSDYTNIAVSKDYVYSNKIYPDGFNGPRAYNFQFYTNYYYNIYLVNNDANGDVAATVGAPAGSGNNQYVCGGSTPQTIVDPNYTTAQNKHIAITEANWHWGMSTVNGKTYVEFMIDLDNFYCDRTKGFNYYVTATHVFDKDTTEEETLSLAYPPIQEENTVQPLWVSHINSSYNQGAGVIFTSDYIEAPTLDTYKTWEYYDQIYDWRNRSDEESEDNTDNDSEVYYTWWYFALLRPNGAENQYRIVEVRNGLGDGKAIPFEWGTEENNVQSGDLVYAIHHGNDYVYIQDQITNGSTLYNHITEKELTTHAGKNYVNDNELAMEKRVALWTAGDVIKLNLSSEASSVMKAGSLAEKHNIVLSQMGWNYDGQGDGSYPRREMLWYEPAYVSQNSFELISKSETRKAADAALGIEYLPTETTWDANNDLGIKPLEHFAPEVIRVDGELNEAGWDDDQWITVIETANGKMEYKDGVEPGLQYNTFFKYQIRNDDKYLYVGAEYPLINYSTKNAPNFTLWIKSDDAANTWTHRYNIEYLPDGSVTLKDTDTQIADEDYVIDNADPVLDGPVGTVETGATLLPFGNVLSFDYNDFNENKTKTDPNGLNNLATHGAYGESALYGYTEEVQENQDTTGAYYPIIKTEKIYLGKESAVMCKKTGKETVAVEFKIALNEFTKEIRDENNNIIGYEGFEYYVEAGYQDNDIFYPIAFKFHITLLSIWND